MTTTNGTPGISPVQQIEALHQRLVKAHEIVANGKVYPIVGLETHFAVQASTGGFYLVPGYHRHDGGLWASGDLQDC